MLSLDSTVDGYCVLLNNLAMLSMLFPLRGRCPFFFLRKAINTGLCFNALLIPSLTDSSLMSCIIAYSESPTKAQDSELITFPTKMTVE